MQAHFLDQFYPFQQNCNLPKLLVTFRNYSLNFLTVAFSSYASLLRFLVAHTVRRCGSAFGLRITIIASFSVFSFQDTILLPFGSGGPKWTRTIDLTIISRVL